MRAFGALESVLYEAASSRDSTRLGPSNLDAWIHPRTRADKLTAVLFTLLQLHELNLVKISRRYPGAAECPLLPSVSDS